MDLEKGVIPLIKDYEALESTLREVSRLLEQRRAGDLHVLRRLKIVPVLIEICKRINTCRKTEFKHIGKVLTQVISILAVFCGLRENRNYML